MTSRPHRWLIPLVGLFSFFAGEIGDNAALRGYGIGSVVAWALFITESGDPGERP